MEEKKKNGEIALACEFLGALGLSVLSSIDRLRMGLIMKFYETYKDRKDELREVFEMPLKDANKFLTVRIPDDELGFSGEKPGETEEYIEEFRRNPQILAKYYSEENPKPKHFIPMLKQSCYIKDPKGGKGYHEVIFNDCWISYIFPEKNFALLDIDIREKIAEKSRCAAHIYEEACGYKFRFDSSLKYFDMDERKVRMKFGFDRFSVKGELREEDNEYEFNSKGYVRSRDLYNKILKEQVEKVIREFYDSHELPFWIEVEKVVPRRYKTKRKASAGRPKDLQPPRYRFWVRFSDIRDADAVEIKDNPTPTISSDVKHEIYLFRITLGEILRVNGYPDKLATDYSQRIADQVKERSVNEPDLAHNARKKIEELPMKYSGRKVYDIFKLIRTTLWNYRQLGEDPELESSSVLQEKETVKVDPFWPTDNVEEQIAILSNNRQKVLEIMSKNSVSPEYFDAVMDGFKDRLYAPKNTGDRAMKTVNEAWKYFRNWLNTAASNYISNNVDKSNDKTDKSYGKKRVNNGAADDDPNATAKAAILRRHARTGSNEPPKFYEEV